ncbi:MAG: membrane protein insertase YidC [Oscillospiraceae bacterium]|nr:membrane protein insertase YidC [Oscillospiraceae bacterium]
MGNIVGYPLGWIMWALYQLVSNYGVALILFTLVLKIAMFPLSVKQQKSTAQQAVMAPKLQALQKRYAKDKERLNEEMTKFYKEEKYNPMSGCLPMLLQFVVLFGLIDVIYNPLKHILRFSKDVIAAAGELVASASEKAATASQQLAIIAAVKDNPAAFASIDAEFGINFVEKVQNFELSFLGLNLGEMPSWAWPIILVPFLSGITSLIHTIYSSYMQKKNAIADDPANNAMLMKGMMYIMPVFSFIFAMQVPAGVGIYWTVSNVLSLVQSFYLNKKYNPKKLAAEIEAAEAEKKKLKKESKQELKEKLEEGKEVTKELEEKALSAKELNRRKLAEARKREAEKYGETYKEVTDEDLI